jgi:lysophospholipase L1-like esterase
MKHVAILILSLSASAALAQQPWVTTWAAGMDTTTYSTTPIAATTFRNKVRISLGGTTLRVTLSNENGIGDLAIGAASVGISAGTGKGNVVAPQPLTFAGSPTITLAAGTTAVSDPVSLAVPKLSVLQISVYLPSQVVAYETFHQIARETNYSAAGNQTAATVMPGATPTTSWYFLKSVDVQASAPGIVTLGDSITDGFQSTINENRRWPDYLAQCLSGNIGVANVGISGNQLLASTANGGPSGMVQVQPTQPNNVLTLAGTKYLIVLEGLNDILHQNGTSDQVIAGLTTVVQNAHAQGVLVYGGTITPTAQFTADQNVTRETVNDWIRTSGTFDAVFDFDQLLADPANPDSLNPTYDSGDGLHPNDAGDKLMAESINKALF